MLKLTTNDTEEQAPEIEQSLDEMASEGARPMILAAPELEVEQYIQASSHVPDEPGQAMVVRNGKSHHERTVNLEEDHLAHLVILGLLPDGQKEMVALEDGYGELTGSWAVALRDLKHRGLTAPVLAAGACCATCTWGTARSSTASW